MSEPCDGCAADATHYLCDLCASEDIEKVTKERDEAVERAHRADLLFDDARNETTEALTRAERAEADAARLREALTGLLDNLNGYEHHPDLCSRTAECDELTPDEFCSQCGDEACPACECGLDKTQQAMESARAALAGEEGRDA